MAAKGKKLAILGHKTRGHEVIELLKIMGGKICAFDYDSDGYAYYIDTSNMIICSNENTIKQNLDKYQLFTLEEFWEKYPFKVGDKVIDEADGCPGVVCEMKWDEGLSDMKYCVAFGNGIDFGWFANDSINFFKIKKNENLEENKFPSFELMFKMNDELEYKIPDGYEITEVSKDKVFIKPIKSKYPTTYEECYDEGNTELHFIYVDKDERDLYESFIQLIRCRNAYWKIAGEEMGLGKPWKPDWNNLSTNHEFIKINKGCFTYSSRLLVFPTTEMRDAFSENFKDLIEQCKELL